MSDAMLNELDASCERYFASQGVKYRRRSTVAPPSSGLSIDLLSSLQLPTLHQQAGATMADLQGGLMALGAQVLSKVDAGVERVAAARAAELNNPLSRTNLCAGLSSDELTALDAEWPAVEEYLSSAGTYAKLGLSLSDYVTSRVADREGVFAMGCGFNASEASGDLDSALSKASAIVRNSHPQLSATGMYLE